VRLDLLNEFLDSSEAELFGGGEDLRETKEGGSEGGEIARASEVGTAAGHEAFDVTQHLERITKVTSMNGRSEESGNRVVTPFDFLGVKEGLLDPSAEQTGTHWSAGLVKDAEQGESARAVGEVLGELE
jgi:hypothetical protein